MNDVLVGLLEAEHAAIYAYGLLGAHLDDAQRPLALACFDAHRASRDALRGLLGAGAPAPAAAYDVIVSTAAQARALAIRIEDDLAGRWHDLVPTPAYRPRAVQGLQDCAVRGAQWRRLAAVLPWTQAFPGASSGVAKA